MKIESDWRVLTIGDGDLSFSAAVQQHYSPEQLTATVLDSQAHLIAKYSQNGLDELINSPASLHFDVDLQDIASWKHVLRSEYDLVIFQFPLITAQASERGVIARAQSTNLQNRELLYDFLRHCRDHWLDPRGAGLCYVTSKEVKPYTDWRIEGLADTLQGLHFCGTQAFDSGDFPGYLIRNVDRDQHVKDTAAMTFVWQKDTANPLNETLSRPARCQNGHCRLCGNGPFHSEQDRLAHQSSRRHQRMLVFERAWLQRLQEKEQTP